MFKMLAKILKANQDQVVKDGATYKYADETQEKLWQAKRAIAELQRRLEKEQRMHHRTRNVYRNVLIRLQGKADIDRLVSEEAKKYDRCQLKNDL